MTIYLTKPAIDVLIAYAWQKYPDATKLILYLPDAQLRQIAHPERTDGMTYTFSDDHLWALMKRDQALMEKSGARDLVYV